MRSPFPGMDPWLEDPRLWPDVHSELISLIRERLNRSLRPRYHARIEERVYLSDDDDPGRKVIIPDLKIRPSKKRTLRIPADTLPEINDPIVAITMIDPEVHELYVSLVDTTDRSVVTVIEILSPSNKVPHARGRDEYLLKRRNVMTSNTHLVEINLLRAGERLDYGPTVRLSDYLIHVSHSSKRPKGWLWTWSVEEPLPAVPIPLRGSDPDFPLALKPILDAAYERGSYDLVVDYGKPPDPPLPRRQAGWARKLLRGWKPES